MLYSEISDLLDEIELFAVLKAGRCPTGSSIGNAIVKDVIISALCLSNAGRFARLAQLLPTSASGMSEYYPSDLKVFHREPSEIPKEDGTPQEFIWTMTGIWQVPVGNILCGRCWGWGQLRGVPPEAGGLLVVLDCDVCEGTGNLPEAGNG